MCDPATLVALGMSAKTAATVATVASTVSTVAAVGGAVLSAGSAYQQSKMAQNQANYQAQVNRNNQIIADRKSQDALEVGQEQSFAQKARGKDLQARQLAIMASQGADVGEGSNVDLYQDAAMASKMEEEVILRNAENTANAYREKGVGFQNQANLYQASADSQNPLMAGGTQLFSSFGKFADKWYTKKQGVQ